ncbi:HAD family hydrolase [Streptoalloteichus hindustanus]|uniref:Haloacid dehalogenase superfamily, subfamily IA, variant 3 with third motif having DD or ED n=1 Tax=Streptoalloteichus hindustanus TaxID=2017 RepID=Q2MEX6_STRHI|nr:HAD family phosphatase [Streptoalloteichus hindustanus]CAI47648.1 putative phosphosugar mutase [Streptoalloteichus hindustanus]SHG39084.1 haloacid dehalogenase superfamily, subfamily IA, variant 3 with third motif having DD or ED [Streptoalloteichus hindustanus]
MRDTENAALVVLDIDGTLLDTPHLPAWRRGLARVLRDHAPERSAEITVERYHRHIAGRPRQVGARAALELAGLAPPPALVDELAAVKQQVFLEQAEETVLFPDAGDFLDAAALAGTPLAFCTASRNAGELLAKRLPRLDGGDWLLDRLHHSLGPHGHYGDVPRPEALRRVAAAWGAAPDGCVLVDDALSGVLAGQQVGMTAVLVDRFGLGVAAPGCPTVSTLAELVPVSTGVRFPAE